MRENIVETWAYYRLPVAHHKHLKSTNMLERFHQEIKTQNPGGEDLSKCTQLPPASKSSSGSGNS